MTDTRDPISISIPEAAALLGVSTQHAYDLAAQDRLPGLYRLSEHGRVLVHRPTLIAAIEKLASKAAS